MFVKSIRLETAEGCSESRWHSSSGQGKGSNVTSGARHPARFCSTMGPEAETQTVAISLLI